MEQLSREELEPLYYKSMQDLKDALYEKELYREDSRKIRYENASLKDSLSFEKKQHEKTFIEFCHRLFPKFIKQYEAARFVKMHVVRDLEDGMFGIVRDGFGTNTLKCFMEDESERIISTDRKDWIQ